MKVILKSKEISFKLSSNKCLIYTTEDNNKLYICNIYISEKI